MNPGILDFRFWIRRRRSGYGGQVFDLTSRMKKLQPQAGLPTVLNCAIVSLFTIHALLILSCVLQTPAFAADDSADLISSLSENPKSAIENRKSKMPSAPEILAQVRANLPRKTLIIKGQILSGGRLGKLERFGYVEMRLDFGSEPAFTHYKICDAFGTPVEQVTISLAAGCEPEFEHEAGNLLRAAPAPDDFIRKTDFTWNDLALLFLWRPDGRVVREDSLRGRDCYVIEFPGSFGPAIQNRKSKIENITKIWIDAQMLVLIQMEELDGLGKLQRRMVVKNIKKISDRWMIKDLEIRSYPSLHHTLIRVDEVVGSP